MGCVSSKQAAASVTPAFDYSYGSSGRSLRSRTKRQEWDRKSGKGADLGSDVGESGRASSNADSVTVRLGNLHKYIEGEQVAAGWPAWLTAVAGEAIQGWVPLRADTFEKLEKIGQGTYSSVFRARDLDTGKIVALKKVKFDNFEPESVRFMAREIQILRRLDHPNVVKLDGLITSRLSCSIYLVFEYMEHDIAGLSSCSDIKFTEPQIKCYMNQLLSALEHCHSRGVMHRDIKGSNLLVNNEGILKMADFGLANFFSASRRQPLTSRVVTLWYRPPELLLGSTDYGPSVDLWSVGCVFAELLLGKPILQGRTEVEQLHKIFRLCGSPSDEYWKSSKLPHATIFKPQQPYESSLPETCKGFPTSAMGLVETLLSVEPNKRGTASSALASEYFTTKPYACDPSTMPKYPPNKEIDAKSREAKNRDDARRRKTSTRARGFEAKKLMRACKVSRESIDLGKPSLPVQEACNNAQAVIKDKGKKLSSLPRDIGNSARLCVEPLKPAVKVPDEERLHIKHPSQGDIPFSAPLHVAASSGFAWATKRKEDSASFKSNSRSNSRGAGAGTLDPSNIIFDRRVTSDPRRIANGDNLNDLVDSKGSFDKIANCAIMKQWRQIEAQDSFDASENFHSQDLTTFSGRDELLLKPNVLDERERVEFSGPLLSQSSKVDELLAKHERRIRQAVRRSWFQRGRKHG